MVIKDRKTAAAKKPSKKYALLPPQNKNLTPLVVAYRGGTYRHLHAVGDVSPPAISGLKT